jgi:hypothetical protein
MLQMVIDEIIQAMHEVAYDRPEDLVRNPGEVAILKEEDRSANKIVLPSTAENQELHQGVSPKHLELKP